MDTYAYRTGPGAPVTRRLRWAAFAVGLMLVAGIATFSFSKSSEAASVVPDPGRGSLASPDTCVSSDGYGIAGYGIPGYATVTGYGIPGYAMPGYTPGYGIPGYVTPGYGTPGIVAPSYGTFCTNLQCAGLFPYYGSSYLCPGPPANISVAPNPAVVTCGSQTDITTNVTDANGYAVFDGTSVNFSTSLGYVTGQVGTTDGNAIASLVIPTKTAGTAQITIYAGGIQQTKTVQVYC